ncbi:MAG TPA: ATP-binding protein [Actinomycetales bacterium]
MTPPAGRELVREGLAPVRALPDAVRRPAAERERAEVVFEEASYVSLVRATFLARLLALTLGVAAVPPRTALSAVAVVLLGVVSVVGLRGDALVRLMLRHPLVGVADAVLTIAAVALIGLDTPVALSCICSALLVGLIYRALYAWPLMVILVAGTLGVSAETLLPSAGPRQVLLLGAGLPALQVGLAFVGAVVRRGFAEIHSTRREAAGALAEARAADERARLAREMHDSLGKSLHGIGLAAGSLPGYLRSDPQVAEAIAVQLAEAAESAAAQGRRILLGLREGQTDQPLAVVLGDLCRQWERDHGIRASLRIDGLVDVDHETTRQVRDVCSEALHNVAKHSGASAVRIALARVGSELQLEVADDGRGFDPQTIAARERDGHFGIRGMRERAQMMRGTLWLSSRVGHGTTVRWAVPAQALEP